VQERLGDEGSSTVGAVRSVTASTRSGLSAAIGIVAVVGVLASLIALWARNVLFDSSRVAAAVDSALQEPETVQSLAVVIGDRVFEVIDPEPIVVELLPSNLDAFVPVLVQGLREALVDRVETTLQDDRTRAVLVQLTEQAHAAAMRLLQGDGLASGITVADGAISLNLLPLISRALVQLQELGFLAGVEVPQLDASGDPAEQLAALEAALDRTIPPELGQLVVYRSESVADGELVVQEAQRVAAVVKRNIVIINLVTVLALIASVVLARRRRRALLFLGIGVVIAAFIARRLIFIALDQSPLLVVDPGGRAAIRAALSSLASGLLTALAAALVIGAIVAIVSWLRGPGTRAAKVRSWRPGATPTTASADSN
jgi:hypothetical protein